MAAGEELSRLEELLRRPDFVLEPSVKESVRQYIKAGGKPEVILESLSEGYIGYPHMAMLMVKWMEYVDEEPPSGHDEFYYLKEFAKSKFDPDKFISVFGSQSSGARLAWLDGLLADPRGRKLIYELSALHRNSLLLNFAIQKIMKMGYQDEVAAAGSGLASYFSVFHRLLANKVSALLATARRAAEADQQLLLEQGGAAASSSSASSSSQAAAIRAQADREVAGLVKELRDCCEHSQHTYLHVQHVLHHLGSQPGGEVLLAAAQQLEADVAAAAPSVPVWIMQKLYAPPGFPPAQVDACHLIGRILQAGPDGPSGPDIQRLHGIYAAAGDAAAGAGAAGAEGPEGEGRGGGGGDRGGLSTAPLQHPRLVQSLLACIFTPGRPPSHELLTACADLLARATCSRPAAAANAYGRGSAGGGGAHSGSGGGARISPDEPGAQGGGPGPGGEVGGEATEAEAEAERERTADRVAETVQAVHWAVGLLFRPHGRFTEEDMGLATQISRLPVVAHGLLHAVSCQLGSPGFYEDAAAAAAALPSLLRISLLVTEGQPPLRSRILASWSSALTALPRAGLAELCRLVLDSCLALIMRAGAAAEGAAAAAGAGGTGPSGSGGGGEVVREVLELVEGWSRQGGADPALVKYFVFQALALFAPPYSPEVVGPLLRLLLAAGLRHTTVRSQAGPVLALLREFAAAAEGLLGRLNPPASARECYLVTELLAPGTGPPGAGAGGAR